MGGRAGGSGGVPTRCAGAGGRAVARRRLRRGKAGRTDTHLGVAVERLQDVVVLGRDVAVLQLEQRRVGVQVDTAELGRRARLLLPQALQVALGELGLQLRAELCARAHAARLAQRLVRRDRRRIPARRHELQLSSRGLRDDQRLGEILEVGRRRVPEAGGPPLIGHKALRTVARSTERGGVLGTSHRGRSADSDLGPCGGSAARGGGATGGRVGRRRRDLCVRRYGCLPPGGAGAGA